MLNISMKTMLEAGVHFGHQTYRWNPKMNRFIFGERNGIHILDLQKTVKELKKAYAFVKECAKQGKRFIFVGTKKQAKDIIKQEAERINVPCVYEKWLGGMLTNYQTLSKSFSRLEELEKMESEGLFKVMSKKEVSRLVKEQNRLTKLLSGIRYMGRVPDIMFVIDPIEEMIAVREARKLGITIVGICDTNCDPDLLDVPIPGNDDAARSIKLFCSAVADAIEEGRKEKEADDLALAQAAAEEEQSEAKEQIVPTETQSAETSSQESDTNESLNKDFSKTQEEVPQAASDTEPAADIKDKDTGESEKVKTEE